MTVTSHLFEAYLKCPTKCYLRSLGEAGTGNTYANWLQTQNETYRNEGLKRLMEKTLPDEQVISPPDTKCLKSAKWRFGIDIDIDIRTPNIESRIHAIERVPSDGRDARARFIPVRYIFSNKLSRDDKLLLAFDTLTLSETLGRAIAIGKIVHGDSYATHQIKIRDYLILLSICETCKCKGASFLDFLLSGEKDIDAFGRSKWKRAQRAVTS